MRVVVTGATGLLGANVVRALLGAGHAVRVGVRARSNPLALEGLDVERFTFDVTAPATLVAPFQGADAVIHAAAAVTAGRTGRPLLHEVHVFGTQNVCEAAARAGIRRLVHVSSASAVGRRADAQNDASLRHDPRVIGDPYADTKALADDVVDVWVARGLDAVLVFPTYMLGPWDTRPTSGRMILEIAAGRGWIAPPGVNDFVDVRSVAQGLVTALSRGETGGRYLLTGAPHSYREIWARIAGHVGARPPIATAPAAAVRALGSLGDRWADWTGREPTINGVSAAYATLQDYRFTADRAARDLGYRPGDLDAAIRDAWAWFRSHQYA